MPDAGIENLKKSSPSVRAIWLTYVAAKLIVFAVRMSLLFPSPDSEKLSPEGEKSTLIENGPVPTPEFSISI